MEKAAPVTFGVLSKITSTANHVSPIEVTGTKEAPIPPTAKQTEPSLLILSLSGVVGILLFMVLLSVCFCRNPRNKKPSESETSIVPRDPNHIATEEEIISQMKWQFWTPVGPQSRILPPVVNPLRFVFEPEPRNIQNHEIILSSNHSQFSGNSSISLKSIPGGGVSVGGSHSYHGPHPSRNSSHLCSDTENHHATSVYDNVIDLKYLEAVAWELAQPQNPPPPLPIPPHPPCSLHSSPPQIPNQSLQHQEPTIRSEGIPSQRSSFMSVIRGLLFPTASSQLDDGVMHQKVAETPSCSASIEIPQQARHQVDDGIPIPQIPSTLIHDIKGKKRRKLFQLAKKENISETPLDLPDGRNVLRKEGDIPPRLGVMPGNAFEWMNCDSSGNGGGIQALTDDTIIFNTLRGGLLSETKISTKNNSNRGRDTTAKSLRSAGSDFAAGGTFSFKAKSSIKSGASLGSTSSVGGSSCSDSYYHVADKIHPRAPSSLYMDAFAENVMNENN
ncbi:hypothetical protein BDR26DRAFT_918239 [Obelidium mucronatum]|nr:hypothetical protein BDR26DRAFT_918239 [Obelidium mucronatum]